MLIYVRNIFVFLLFSLLLISGVFAEETCPFKFVMWGDSQFNNPDVFEKAVLETELLKPDFVIQVGDLINGYTYDVNKVREEWVRFKKQIEPLSVPYYPVPGNHDVTTTPTEPIYGEVWGNDKYYYSFDYNKSHFIILNTDLHTQEDQIPEEEMEWFKSDLEKNKDKQNIFIAFHSPLYANKDYNWQPIHDMLKKYPVRAIFTGHSHIYNHKIQDDIRYFCINTSGEMMNKNHLAGFSHCFVVVSVDGTKVDYAVVADGTIFPPDAVGADESSRANNYFEKEKTFIIPDSSDKSVDATISVPIKNQTKEQRSYTLRWETNNFDFRFEPTGIKFELNPGEIKETKFNITIPKGKFYREDLPKLKIESPYKNSAGWQTILTSYFYLFNPPETKAKRLSGQFIFDGKIDDEVWRDIPSINTLYTDKKGTQASEKTIIKVIYDDEYVYFGIEGEEPNPAGLKSDAAGSLPLVFADDDFEIYIDPYRDLSTFYRLMVNPKGTVLCSDPKGLFTFKFEVKTSIGKNWWSAEFKIPYSEINAKQPQAGDIWGINIRRARQQAVPFVSEWSRMRGFPAQPEYFGILKFQ